ncbi:type I polyketide synthase [Micromonospora sp. LOL_024]|uniref:type I polyketide synthase n=1 Tax=Micromonospora sp. LOL_024 TaxID=3345412 RepID=UPI003A8677DF
MTGVGVAAELEPDARTAIVGMACRYPGAADLDGFWRLLVRGAVAATEVEPDDTPARQPAAGRHVPRGYFLDDIAGFDAEYFGLTDLEAEATDPGFRIFLECAHTALLDAGHEHRTGRGSVGVFAGASRSPYGTQHVARNRRLAELFSETEIQNRNEPDFLAGTAAHRLGLDGPGVVVASLCSTSLVAVHLACQAIRSGDCDLALAGAVDLTRVRPGGYRSAGDGMLSVTGHCRSFDASADGTVLSSGTGVVVLRGLADALADGDHIYAVIHGSAVTNDGAARPNFTTPTWDGQAASMRRALTRAGVTAASLGYVECHAPGTPVGDLVEVTALEMVFREQGVTTPGACLIGSVKPNIGHAGVAAGVAGLIKAALMVHHGVVPPTANFTKPNPDLGLVSGPFTVATGCTAWPAGDGPRRALVGSVGAGGTNAHVVIEQPPPRPADQPGPGSAAQLLPLSGRTPAAVAALRSGLEEHLGAGSAPLGDVAFTLQRGRHHDTYRVAVVAATAGTGGARAVASFTGPLPAARVVRRPRVVFLFPGLGVEYAGMGRELYDTYPVYRRHLDECLAALRPHVAGDLDGYLGGASGPALPGAGPGSTRAESPGAAVTLPALFAVEVATARLWTSWGIRPSAMLGHSAGEYAAAVVAGWLELPAAARTVAARSALLDRAGVTVQASRVTDAGHSPLLEPTVPHLAEVTDGPAPRLPRVPVVSTVTGDWLTDDDALDTGYWVRQLRAPVRFHAAARRALATAEVFVEVGPGQTLTGLVETVAEDDGGRVPLAVPTIHRRGESVATLSALARLWCHGVEPDWRGVWTGRQGRRVPLLGYPYQRRQYLAVADDDAGCPAPAALLTEVDTSKGRFDD